jgi:ferredoxin
MYRSQVVTLITLWGASLTLGFQITPGTRTTTTTSAPPAATTSSLFAATMPPKKKGYEPKWKKKETLADKAGGGPQDFKQIGLVGTVPVVFKQGNVTKTTMAIVGQPLRDVATQAGQFIKYGCGKGECGTCECMMDGKWVRPCSTNVPSTLAPGQELVLQITAIKNKGLSSGKFYSLRSFLMGFWNNLIGMIGFVKFRRAATKNWDERQEYEDMILQRTIEKKRLKKLQDEGATPA